jgi:DNA-directed DNA polymerase III PolC
MPRNTSVSKRIESGGRAAPGPTPVPLIVRSGYSLGRGTATPDRLLARAASLGLDAIALTDRDNLYGGVAFLKKAAEMGIHPILGAEVSPREGAPLVPGEDGARGIGRGPYHAPGSLVLLIREPAGYASLCRILTARNLAPEFDLLARVARHAEGLYVLAREPEMLGPLREALPRGALFAAAVRPARSIAEEAALRDCARRLDVPVVGTIDVSLSLPEEAATNRVLAAVRENDLVSRLHPEQVAPSVSALAGPAEIFSLFADDPASLTASRDLALSCRFGASDLPKPGSLFPKLPLPPGETAYDRLYRMTQEGLRRRYTRVTREITQRLAWELEQIDSMGFTDYFVVVGDLTAAARARGIPTVGRGSGASSLVSYLLGITNVDPLRYQLTFERFLHRLRRDLPDLDIDLCWKKRDDVIHHVYETYGADRVAMISVHNHYQSRGAFREAGKALGLTAEQIDGIARAIPAFSDLPLIDAIRATPRGRGIDLADPRIREACDAAGRLIGLPHTLGIHCGGIVIGPGPLDTWVPLEMATKGIVVTQYEMHAVEDIGLVKIDLLGNRALSTIRETLDVIRATESNGATPDLDAIPDPDPATARLLERGETLGCFQIESPGMRNLLKMLRTGDLDGTIAALSLIRPGPAGSGMKERFVRRARGIEEVTYLHPSLESLLASTYGVLLYEEDVICVASAIGGFDRAVGDLLRRAIGKATAVSADPSLGERPLTIAVGEDPWKGSEMRELENRFIACAVRNGVPPDVAREVWGELARFGSYAFCKAHASGYGVLAYQTTWLKAHHAGAFHAALMNNHQGMYPLRVHVEEARRRGVSLAPPCVHRSEEGWTWDGTVLRCGLGQVVGLSRRTREAILKQRARAPFEEIADFLARTGAAIPEAESLILCGALDDVGLGPRTARLWRLRCLARNGSVLTRSADGTASLGIAGRDQGIWRDFDLETRVRHELDTLEIAISAHPVTVLRAALDREGRLPSFVDAADLSERGGRTSILGIVSASRRVVTKRGDSMLFLTLEDPSGLAECTLWPDVYARFGALVRESGLLLARGIVEAQYGAPTLAVDSLESFVPRNGEASEHDGGPAFAAPAVS